MLGKYRGVGRHNPGELAFKRCGDTGVQLSPPVAQQRPVGGILYQAPRVTS
jgi:hypothetical protein